VIGRVREGFGGVGGGERGGRVAFEVDATGAEGREGGGRQNEPADEEGVIAHEEG